MSKSAPAPAGTLDYAPTKRFTVGTLTYSKGGLLMLFSWLLWNDLCLMLMENVAPQLVPLMFKEHGASNTQIALFTSTLVGLCTIWINPVVSTWSDRYRSRAGRRRPFLFFATPFCAVFLAAIPFMPDLFNFLSTFPALHDFLARNSAFGVIFLIGLCYLAYQVFNNVLLAIFTYYFWDVVPQEVLGRFTALTRIVSVLAVFFWNYFLFGLSQNHLKAVFVGVAVFFFTAYMISLWRVKEGEYPPPPVAEKPGFFNVIRSYFTDCFTPYYLWFILANAVFQIGNVTGAFKMILFVEQYHMERDLIGKWSAWPTLLIIVIGYPMGALVDRLKPARVLIVAVFFYALFNIAAFYYMNNKWALFYFNALFTVVTAAQGVAMGVFTASFFPREKLGQFCSANAMTYNLVAGVVGAFICGKFMDWIADYRYAFFWSAGFYLLSVPLYIKCYYNWRRREAQLAVESIPEPPEPPVLPVAAIAE